MLVIVLAKERWANVGPTLGQRWQTLPQKVPTLVGRPMLGQRWPNVSMPTPTSCQYANMMPTLAQRMLAIWGARSTLVFLTHMGKTYDIMWLRSTSTGRSINLAL